MPYRYSEGVTAVPGRAEVGKSSAPDQFGHFTVEDPRDFFSKFSCGSRGSSFPWIYVAADLSRSRGFPLTTVGLSRLIGEVESLPPCRGAWLRFPGSLAHREMMASCPAAVGPCRAVLLLLPLLISPVLAQENVSLAEISSCPCLHTLTDIADKLSKKNMFN
ncbi:hypothetical protein Bbelb_325100 [Branchiostoma belcheri]|nr:hypothetical protein Bbelb_325100 [Branchiostoma belcheri]